MSWKAILPHIFQSLLKPHSLSPEQCLVDLKYWYNGYNFTEVSATVYNPFSILHVLHKKLFKNYWFESATPTFLIQVIKERDYPIPSMEFLRLSEEAINTYELEYLTLEPLLLQTGYITIKHYRAQVQQKRRRRHCTDQGKALRRSVQSRR